MARQKGKKQIRGKGVYQMSLIRLLWHAGLQCIVLSAAIFVLLVLIIVFTQPDRFFEYFPLALGFFAILLLVLVGFPLGKMLFFLKQQERVLGKCYRDRADFDLLPKDRAWYLAFQGAGLTVIHREYLAKVNKIALRKEEAENGSTSCYEIRYEDCLGQQKTFRIERLKSEVSRFQEWYAGGKAVVEENEDDEFFDDTGDAEEK